MRRLRNIPLEGEKLSVEVVEKNNKRFARLHMLVGVDSIEVTVKDASLENEIRAVPDRDCISLMTNIQAYKDGLYFDAVELVG